MLKAAVWALAGVTLLGMQPPAAGITVSAAASLTDVMEAVARAYEAEGGGPVRFNFAGSNVLARQIASGAPVDVFVSADRAQMDVAARAGAIDADTRVDLLGNRLAIVTRGGTPSRRPEDLVLPAIRRIAVGDPAAVPSGVYARQYFTRLGLWERLEPKLVPVGNVRAALAAVENGSVDAAVVFVTDASLAKGEVASLTVDDRRAPEILYPAAIVRAAPNRPEAERFLAFLRGPQASAIFERFGFLPAPSAAGGLSTR
jgi:molybdate transport system substrate-binding protein